MVAKAWSRRIGACVVTAIVLAGCSGSDDDTDPSSPPPPPETDASPETTADDGLTGEGLEVGLLTPPPGLLSTLFRGQDRGVGFAVDDVDGTVGVLDGPLTVTPFTADPGGEVTEAVTAAADADISTLIGPAGSDDAEAVRDQLAADGGLACTASASIPRLTLDQETPSIVRTVLSDDVVTTYLARYIEERHDAEAPDAPWTVAIVARDDAYGVSVSAGLAATLQAAGLEPVVVNYDHRQVMFRGTASEVAGVGADLTVLVSYAEGANLLGALADEGIDPTTMIGLDSFFRARIASIATPGSEGDPASLDGFTMIGSMGDKAFLERLYTDDENGEAARAPQAYDCAVVLALATELIGAGDDADASFVDAVIDVTGDGTTCTTYDDCVSKLRAGENIDYDGVSGRIDLDEHGDPDWARFTTAVLSGGAISDITATDVDIAELRSQYEAYAAANQIAMIQQALRFLGFYDGPINGLDTEAYRTALAAFQASVGLPPTGVFDEATDAALRAALGPYAEFLSATTADIQRLLTDLGFYDGPIDGIWTEEVTEAIRALQRELGVPETGVFDAATLRAIYARGEETGSTTTTAPATTAPPTTAPPTTAPPTTAPPTTTPPDVTTTTTAPIPPPTDPSLLEVLQSDPRFSNFVEVVVAAGFDDGFTFPDQMTVFAPTNEALTDELRDELLALDIAELQRILSYYAADGRLLVADLASLDELDMISGDVLPVTDGGNTVGGAAIGIPDLLASNGVVQGLDALFDVPDADDAEALDPGDDAGGSDDGADDATEDTEPDE